MYVEITQKYTPGRHCCLWCLIKGEQLAIPQQQRGSVMLRTTESIVEDHHRFLADGGNIKKAKYFNNAIGLPIFPIIPLSQVRILPYKCTCIYIQNIMLKTMFFMGRYALLVSTSV